MLLKGEIDTLSNPWDTRYFGANPSGRSPQYMSLHQLDPMAVDKSREGISLSAAKASRHHKNYRLAACPLATCSGDSRYADQGCATTGSSMKLACPGRW